MKNLLSTTKPLLVPAFFLCCAALFCPPSGTCQSLILTNITANQIVDSLTKRSLNFYHAQPELAIRSVDSTVQLVVTSVGKNHPAYSRALEVKASMLTDSRKFAQADTLLKEAIQVLRALADTNTTQYAQLLYNCARLKKYENTTEALKLYNQAQANFEKLRAEEHLAYAKIFDDVSFIYHNAGQYEQAATALSKSKEIRETFNQTNKPGYLVTLVNLGALSYALNKKDQALDYFELAAQQYELQNQTAQVNYAVVLNNLGFMYTEMENFEKSKQTYFRSKTLLENSNKTESPEYAQLLLNIGSTHFMLKEYEQAEAALLESKLTYEKAGQQNAILYFRAWRNIGLVKIAQGDYTEAIPVLEGVMEGWAKAVGELDNFYLETVNSLVEALVMTGNYAAAGQQIEACVDLEMRLLNRASAHFSQAEMMDYLPSISLTEHWFGPLLKAQEPPQHTLSQAYYDAQLFRKGYFLQSSIITQHLAAAAPEAVQQRFTAWKKSQEKLTELYALPIAERTLSTDSLETVGINLEKELLQSLPGFAQARQEIRWQAVQRALKPGAAAIEFVDFADSLSGGPAKRMYAALVLLPDSKEPRFVILFEASDLEKLTRRSKSWLSDYTDKLYSFKQPAGYHNLYELLWERLEPALQGASSIYYSPSGLLHRLNPEAIQRKDGSRLADHYTLIKTGSTRQLAAAGDTQEKYKTAVLFGGIQYDADSSSMTMPAAAETRSFDFSEADSTLRRNYWKFLDATTRETQSINRQLGKAGYTTTLKTGLGASEDVLKNIQSPTVLHIATHGFFFPDPANNAASSAEESVFKLSKNPMMRSGLLLAGANHAWQTGRPLRPGTEDGILTAYEISLMNLTGTELVVLSACETGLGDLSGNEGVYGLQRAFKIAGAKYLLMSLWKVPDAQTEALMTLFYQKWLEGPMTIHDAFRAAQSEIRAKNPNPYFWAGFVLME